MPRSRYLVMSSLLICILSTAAFATTWFPKDFICPIDKENNTFQVWGSYGSYIYSWPSKYQWVFWPATESEAFYICKKCHLATYMWDYEKIPADKIPELKKVLADIKVSKKFKEYREVPITERLEIMEKVYTVLGRDDSWWELFYRTEGYHYGKNGAADKALAARKRSLSLVEKLQKDKAAKEPAKVMLYISGAMKHFMSDDEAAIADLKKALAVKYEEEGVVGDEAKQAEDGMNERIRDYIEKIESEKEKPRLFDKYGSDDSD